MVRMLSPMAGCAGGPPGWYPSLPGSSPRHPAHRRALHGLPFPVMTLYCSLSSVAVLVTAVFLPVVAKCPEDVWDLPVDRCSLPMELARPVMHNYSVHVDVRINKTCEAWMESKACFADLRKKCQGERATLAEIWIFEKRYHHYSLPCFDEQYKYRWRLLDCLNPYLGPTQKCVEAFDRTYREFVLDDQFGRACRLFCRVVATVMRCLDHIKKDIRKECSHEGAEVYSRNYIEPIVIQIRPTVSHKCDTNGGADYMEYFNGSDNTKIHTPYVLAISMVTVILVVSRYFTSWDVIS